MNLFNLGAEDAIPMDADVPSPDAVYGIDLDLDLNLDVNVNLSLNTAIAFDHPMWTENDELSKELTDSILTENFNSIADKDSVCDLAFTNDQYINSTNSTNASDFIWNAIQGVEQIYYEDTGTDPTTTSPGTSDLFIYQVEPMIDASFAQNNNDQKSDLLADSFSDICGLDVLKDGLFELDLFGECLKDIEDSSSGFESTIPDYGSVSVGVTAPVVDWNRRRSLLYDKNEFVRTTPDARVPCRRYQNGISRIKSPVYSPLPSSSCELNNNSSRNGAMEQRIYKCSVGDCEKTYCKASHLKSHMRRHSGVKPFACDWDGCKWRFSRSDELARHKRSHSGIKPYSCDLCDKAFSRSDHLSKHAKVHMKKMALYGTPIITKKCNYKYLSVNRIPVE